MNKGLIPVTAPDLVLQDIQSVVGAWLVRRGQSVLAGDRLVEILAGDVLVDVSAPVAGKVVQKQVAEDVLVQPGQVLCWIRPGRHPELQ